MPDPAAIILWIPQGPELIVILVVVLILFGGTKLPQLMRGMGTGIKEFKQAIKDEDDVEKPQQDVQDSKPQK